MEAALEAGADDVIEEESEFQVITGVETFSDVTETFEEKGLATLEAAIAMIPTNSVEVSDEQVAVALLKLLENLEDHDDVQKVHANFDIDAALMERLS